MKLDAELTVLLLDWDMKRNLYKALNCLKGRLCITDQVGMFYFHYKEKWTAIALVNVLKIIMRQNVHVYGVVTWASSR